MSLPLPHLLEVAADEVASVGRAAAGSLNELVHDWGHETRAFVSEHAPSLPGVRPKRRSHNMSLIRLLVPAVVLGVAAVLVMKRRRPAQPAPRSEPYSDLSAVKPTGAAAH